MKIDLMTSGGSSNLIFFSAFQLLFIVTQRLRNSSLASCTFATTGQH